jgi:transposase-like protein
MIYANTAAQVEKRRKAFLRKWRLKSRAVADSLEEAGARLFTFTRLNPSQWKSARTTNAIERLNAEFHRRIKTQTVLPCAETVPVLLWALLASGQIQMRKVTCRLKERAFTCMRALPESFNSIRYTTQTDAARQIRSCRLS